MPGFRHFLALRVLRAGSIVMTNAVALPAERATGAGPTLELDYRPVSR